MPTELTAIPSAKELGNLLGLQEGGENVEAFLSQSLLEPVVEFLRRPAKNIRGQLVELGFQLAGDPIAALSESDSKLCHEGALALELIHAGSLVVDDIQDGSQWRRGGPTLHREHGVGLALNAGNWLYFWPLDRISQWNLPAEKEVLVHRVFHQALLRAHAGQALDVGVRIDEIPQEKVAAICLASLELKTGALMGLAATLGACLRAAQSPHLESITLFGCQFGIALQMFDDIGNLKEKSGPAGVKRLEDLLLRRPSWIWASASQACSPVQYAAFQDSVRALPDETQLQQWLEATQVVSAARGHASAYLDKALCTLQAAVPGHEAAIGNLTLLANRLVSAYE